MVLAATLAARGHHYNPGTNIENILHGKVVVFKLLDIKWETKCGIHRRIV
jgi:hypothetical protein